MHTGWAAIGLAAAGRNPRDLDHDAIAYIRGHASALRGDLGERSRTILAMRAAGLKRFKAGGRNLLAEIERTQEPDGSWQGLVNTTAFAVLALRAAGRPADSRAVRAGVEFIGGQANADGGFNFAGSGRPSGADDTGAALQALGAAGKRRSGVVRRAAAWLESRQNADGGFSLQGGPSNAQSTAWAVQGLIAAGRDPKRVRRNGSRSPVAYLRSLVGSDGAIRYSRTSSQTPVWVTSQAVAALEGKALPLKPVPRARKPRAAAPPAPAATPAPTATPRPQPMPTAAAGARTHARAGLPGRTGAPAGGRPRRGRADPEPARGRLRPGRGHAGRPVRGRDGRARRRARPAVAAAGRRRLTFRRTGCARTDETAADPAHGRRGVG